MGTILHIEASPRGEESFSARAARALTETLADIRPGDTIDTLNVFDEELPAFRAPAAAAKYAVMGGGKPEGEAAKAWQAVSAVIDRFKAADAYVVSSPMWNFSIPYRLKQYIDVIVQPGLTFSYARDRGYEGMVSGPAVILLARGGAYGPGSGMETLDYQRPYVETVLRFMGIAEIETIVLEPTVASGPEAGQQILQRACEQARAAARALAAGL